MLRRLRTSAGLTQERLAEQSGISANGVAALEAGRRRTPRLNTVGLLCGALRVDAQQRAALISAATGTTTATATVPTNSLPETATRASTREESDTMFVGRHDERQALHHAWLGKTKVVLLSGEAGVGKSTLAVYTASPVHRV